MNFNIVSKEQSNLPGMVVVAVFCRQVSVEFSDNRENISFTAKRISVFPRNTTSGQGFYHFIHGSHQKLTVNYQGVTRI